MKPFISRSSVISLCMQYIVFSLEIIMVLQYSIFYFILLFFSITYFLQDISSTATLEISRINKVYVCMYELLYGTVASLLLCSAPWLSLGSAPGRGHFVAFLDKTPRVPLSTLVYKWVPVSLMVGVTLQWTSIPSRG